MRENFNAAKECENIINWLLDGIVEETLSVDAKINIPPRLRMTTLYAIGSSMHYRVCGTGNKSEGFVGYTTKWGDNAFDFNPIGNLTTEEVIAVGDSLGLPYELVHKTPSDGLSGQSDEEKLGFTYKQINDYIEKGSCGDTEIDAKITLMHEYNTHKGELPFAFSPLSIIASVLSNIALDMSDASALVGLGFLNIIFLI